MNIISTFKYPCDLSRFFEYTQCIEFNLNFLRPGDRYHLVIECNERVDLNQILAQKDSRLCFHRIDRRPYFSDLIGIAKDFPENEISVVLNADIYLDNVSSYEILDLIQENELWCLSRYDLRADGKWELNDQAFGYSHDLWAFRSPVQISPSDIYLGIPACDGMICQNAVESGLRVLNPCLSIKIKHLHASQIRNYSANGHEFFTYAKSPGFMQYGIRSYIPLPCKVEKVHYCSKTSFRYNLMKYFGKPILYFHRKYRLFEAFRSIAVSARR